jgi:hypothetical protein
MENAHSAEPGPECSRPEPALAKKFPCPDCSFCQFCSDSRCRCCRSAKTGESRSKMSISEQIRLFDELNAKDPFFRKRCK